MSLADLPLPTFTGAQLSQRTNAALAEARAARRFPTAAAVLADASLAYGSGARPVAAGDRLVTADGHRYEVAASGATDHHVTTAGGVRLYVRPGPRGISFGAWLATANESNGTTDVTAKLQSFANACVGSPTAPNGGTNRTRNIPGILPPGIFRLTDAIQLRSVSGWTLSGAGRMATVLRQVTVDKAVIKTNGCEYSLFEGFKLEGGAANSGALFDLDWDNTGTAALQSNTFRNLFFEGISNNDPSALSVQNGLRIGQGGYMGSENLIESCFFIHLRQGIHVWNYNALQNNVVGGNFQACWKGIKVQAGSVTHIMGVGFQNDLGGVGFDQITVGGWDIEVTNTAGDATIITGCRTESLRFATFGNSHRGEVSGCQMIPSRNVAVARSTAYVVGDIRRVNANSQNILYKCTTAGTTAAAAPTFNDTIYSASGSTTDGTVVWTRQDHYVLQGIPTTRDSYFAHGRVGLNSQQCLVLRNVAFTRGDWQQGNLNQFVNGTILHENCTPQPMTQYVGYGDWVPGGSLSLGKLALLFENNAGNRVGFERGKSGAGQDGIAVQGFLHARAQTGTDANGRTLVLGGGPGTGAGSPGDISLQAPVPTTTGTTEQAFAEGGRFRSLGKTLETSGGFVFPAFTAANLADTAHAVNTSGKRTGQVVLDTTNQRLVYATGTTAAAAWAPVEATYDVEVGFAATPTASQIVARKAVARSMTFPANFAGSVGFIGTNPTASFALTVQVGGTTIGTVTVSTAGAVTFATSGGTAKAVAAGSLLTLVAPAGADATAANFAATLAGSLS